jgi:hypothetical protein
LIQLFFGGVQMEHHSGKARGADTRFGVLAYEGVGPSCLAARAVEWRVRYSVFNLGKSQFRFYSPPLAVMHKYHNGGNARGSEST